MRLPLLLLATLLPAIAPAQDLRPVQCRFMCFGGADDSVTVLAVAANGDEVSCPLSSSSISDPILCLAKGNQLSFLSSADRKPAATATIPAQTKAAILVFVRTPAKPGSTNALPWRVVVVEDSPKSFPDGGAFIANFYGRDIRFTVGEHKGMLHSAGAHGYARPARRDAFNMAPAIFEFQQDDQWRTANETMLRFVPGMRYLIFAFTDPASGRPRIKTYPDFARPTLSSAETRH